MSQLTLQDYKNAQKVEMVQALRKHCGVVIDPKRAFRCLNPAHEDKNPSAHIYKNFYFCFACSWHSLSVIDVVALLRYPVRVENLARGAHRDEQTTTILNSVVLELLDKSPQTLPTFKKRELKTIESGKSVSGSLSYNPKTKKEKLLLDKVLRWYLALGTEKEQEKQVQWAVEFCKEKWGIKESVVREFGLIYRSPENEIKLINRYIKDLSAEETELLLKIKLLFPPYQNEIGQDAGDYGSLLKNHELKTGITENGLLCNVQGRANKTTIKPNKKHISVRLQGVMFNKEILTQKATTGIFIVEGGSDTLMLSNFGFNAVGSVGSLSTLKDPALLRLLFQSKRKKVYVVAEGDQAGEAGANALAERFLTYKRNNPKNTTKLFIVKMPRGKDVCDVLGINKKEWDNLVKQAEQITAPKTNISPQTETEPPPEQNQSTTTQLGDTCGENGGKNKDGRPCGRRTWDGETDKPLNQKTGRCKDHPERPPKMSQYEYIEEYLQGNKNKKGILLADEDIAMGEGTNNNIFYVIHKAKHILTKRELPFVYDKKNSYELIGQINMSSLKRGINNAFSKTFSGKKGEVNLKMISGKTIEEELEAMTLNKVAYSKVKESYIENAEERKHKIKHLPKTKDGGNHLVDKFIKEAQFLGADKNPNSKAYLHTFERIRATLLALVLRGSLKAGTKADWILILTGEGNASKDDIVKAMAMGVDRTNHTMSIKNYIDPRQRIEGTTDNNILLLSEIAGLKDILPEDLRRTTSGEIDKMRPAYHKKRVNDPPRHIAIGTGNEPEVNDPDSRRRLWIIEALSHWKDPADLDQITEWIRDYFAWAYFYLKQEVAKIEADATLSQEAKQRRIATLIRIPDHLYMDDTYLYKYIPKDEYTDHIREAWNDYITIMGQRLQAQNKKITKKDEVGYIYNSHLANELREDLRGSLKYDKLKGALKMSQFKEGKEMRIHFSKWRCEIYKQEAENNEITECVSISPVPLWVRGIQDIRNAKPSEYGENILLFRPLSPSKANKLAHKEIATHDSIEAFKESMWLKQETIKEEATQDKTTKDGYTADDVPS